VLVFKLLKQRLKADIDLYYVIFNHVNLYIQLFTVLGVYKAGT
jgi:hypothetical protein